MSKYSNPRYAMGIDLAVTKKHPGYSASMSAEGNVRKGRAYRGGQSYKEVAKQLQQLANIQHNPTFSHAAELAREKGHRLEEYKGDRKKMYA